MQTKKVESGLKSSWIVRHANAKPKNPILVVGLPGIGFVSKLAVDHLVKSLKAEKIATLYSPHFPNQVIALKSGRLRLFSMRFFFKRLKGRDVIFLKGDIQPLTVEGQYEVCGKVLEYFSEMGGTQVVSMAGFAVESKSDKPAVYCTSTSRKLLGEYAKKHGVKKVEKVVPIVGMAGMLPALAKSYSIPGACLLVETPGTFIDAKAASTLVGVLSSVCGQKFETGNLEARAKKTEETIKRLGEQAAPQKHDEARAVAQMTPDEIIKRNESLSYIR